MHEVMVRVEGGHLVGILPADAHAIGELDGGTYTARLTQPRGRSITQLNLYWAVCGMIADNFEHPDDWRITKEHVDNILRQAAGHSHAIELADGTYRFFNKSIAFNKMHQEDFTAYMDEAFTVAATKFGPALADAARKEFDKMISGQPKERPDAKA